MSKRDLSVLNHYPLGVNVLLRLAWLVGQAIYWPIYCGREHIPAEGPFILVGNHQSNMDVVLLHAELKQPVRWLAKVELFRTATMASFMRSMAAIPVDRSRPDLAAVKSIRKSLKAREVIGIFPQGTRVKEADLSRKLPDDSVIHLLAHSQVPILPFAIEVPLRAFHKNQVAFGHPFYLAREAQEEPERAKRYLMAKIFNLLDKKPNLPLDSWLAAGHDLELDPELTKH